jgi:putative oxidoreductase
VGKEEQMNETPNAQRPTPNAQIRDLPLGVGRWVLDVGRFREKPMPISSRNILWRVIDFILGVLFIFAGIAKILNLDQLIADLQHLRFASAFAELGNLSLENPTEFAHDINNFRILPWTLSVALAFYLPWLEILCGLGLIFRFLYRGALSILIVLIVVFTLATIAAKVRGLDITCGCFGHASQHWSLPAHLATNLTILAALLVLWVSNRSVKHL